MLRRPPEQRRNVVAGMGVVRGQKGIVQIEFADRGAVGPRGPFRRNALRPGQSEHGSARLERMRLGLRPRAVTTGRRATEAAATAALSIMRLPIISSTSVLDRAPGRRQRPRSSRPVVRRGRAARPI